MIYMTTAGRKNVTLFECLLAYSRHIYVYISMCIFRSGRCLWLSVGKMVKCPMPFFAATPLDGK